MKSLIVLTTLVILNISSLSGQAIQGTLLGTWQDSTLVGSETYDNNYNEIWGVVSGGVEYGILGTTRGTHFFDLSDPTNPINIITIDGGTMGTEIIHRDYHDMDGFLYAVSDEGSQSTLQIMDLSFLPDSVSIVYDSKEFIRRSHNIFIDTSSAIMYSCISNGDNVNFAPLRLFDISDPYQPEIIAAYSSISNFNFSQIHDTYVQNDTAYLNCGPDGFLVADFSDPLAPQGLASLGPNDYVQAGYNHSGWLSEDSKTYFMADETWSQDIKVLDVSQMPDLTVIDTIDGGSDHFLSIPHNQVVHGDYLYGSYYYDGLQVWNIKDVTNIKRVMHYPTSSKPHRQNYEGAWGVYPFLPSGIILVSDMQEGLFVIDSVDNTVSNSEANTFDKAWQVSPNPSDGYIEVILNHPLKDVAIELLNMSGEKIQNLERQNQLNLASGIYMVKVTSEGTQSTKKIFISN